MQANLALPNVICCITLSYWRSHKSYTSSSNQSVSANTCVIPSDTDMKLSSFNTKHDFRIRILLHRINIQ